MEQTELLSQNHSEQHEPLVELVQQVVQLALVRDLESEVQREQDELNRVLFLINSIQYKVVIT